MNYTFNYFFVLPVYLLQDERLAELSSIPGLTAHAGLITRVHRLQLLPAADVRTFEISLMPHQKAVSFFYLYRYYLLPLTSLPRR